jgi:hypothetical protein
MRRHRSGSLSRCFLLDSPLALSFFLLCVCMWGGGDVLCCDALGCSCECVYVVLRDVCCAMRAAAPLRCCTCCDNRLRLSHTHVGCDRPRRLIQSAIGGTVIEAWSPNQTTLECQNKTPGTATAGKPNGRLFYGMVCPFVNMSISGWTWYQVSARHPRCAASLCIHVFLHTRHTHRGAGEIG